LQIEYSSAMGGLKLGKEAQAKFDEARTNPDKAGFLDKKGAKRKNWNTRWFVLKDNYLFYCKNEKSLPQGIINLHGCTVSKLEGPNTRQYSFSLLAPKSVSIDAKWTNRTYLMAAKTPEDWKAWIETLEIAGKKSVERAAAAKAAIGGGAGSPSLTSTPSTGALGVEPTGKKGDESSGSDSEDEASPVEVKKVDGPLPIKREDSKTGGEIRGPRRKEESSSHDSDESTDDEKKPKSTSSPKAGRAKEESSGEEESDKLPRTPEAKKHRKKHSHKEKKEKREKKEKKSEPVSGKPKEESSEED